MIIRIRPRTRLCLLPLKLITIRSPVTVSTKPLHIVSRSKHDESLRVPKALQKLHENCDFAFIHFKKTDSTSHAGNVRGKIAAIEKYDSLLKPLLDSGLTVAVTGDHCTPCEFFRHSGDAVPLVYYGKNIRGDSIKKFSEKECAKGSVGTITARDVLAQLVNLGGRFNYYVY